MNMFKKAVDLLYDYFDSTRDLIDPDEPQLNGLEDTIEVAFDILRKHRDYKNVQ